MGDLWFLFSCGSSWQERTGKHSLKELYLDQTAVLTTNLNNQQQAISPPVQQITDSIGNHVILGGFR